MPTPKCIIILSSKSCGSSACQNLLAKLANIRHVEKTRHFENETLYWTKAASILNLSQVKMLDSEVPIGPSKAKKDLVDLLRDNVGDVPGQLIDKEFIFQGWRMLCEHYYPVFIEKSPHHLNQQSALELIIECVSKTPNIKYFFVGLVRNPMDTLYSAFIRQRIPPEKLQHEWYVAYNNLLKFKKIIGKNIHILRYEDMVNSICFMKPIFDFCDTRIQNVDDQYLRRKSLLKWKSDVFYGFKLSDEVFKLALRYGYRSDELDNHRKVLWPFHRDFSRIINKTISPLKNRIRKQFQ